MKVHIRYGIFGGELNGIRLRRYIRQAGHDVTRRIDEADIVIAHSAGCFWLDDRPKNQKLILVDPPYWPGRSIRERARSRSRRNWHFKRYGYTWRLWLYRNLTGVYYLLRDFRRGVHIMRHAESFDLVQTAANRPVLLVRNEYDDWLTNDLTSFLQDHPNVQFVQLPGDHDDINHHPDRYADLIAKLQD